MLAFVDESGDSGRKILQGSSEYFAVSIVTFEDNEDAQECDNRISELRSQLGLSLKYEFHFSHNSKKIREQFLEAVAGYPFFYHTFALNKDPEKLYGPGFDVKESLYKYTTRLTLENAKPYLNNATVIIDESGDRKFRDELALYLRRQIRDDSGRRLIKKVKTQRSSGNNLLQLADYVVGVSNRYIRGKKEGIELRQKYLSPHEVSLRVWP